MEGITFVLRTRSYKRPNRVARTALFLRLRVMKQRNCTIIKCLRIIRGDREGMVKSKVEILQQERLLEYVCVVGPFPTRTSRRGVSWELWVETAPAILNRTIWVGIGLFTGFCV